MDTNMLDNATCKTSDESDHSWRSCSPPHPFSTLHTYTPLYYSDDKKEWIIIFVGLNFGESLTNLT